MARMGSQKGGRAANMKRGMGQEVHKVKQGASRVQPVVGAAFQIIQVDAVLVIALHLWTKGVAGNSSELPFF